MDTARHQRIAEVMRREECDGVICRMPQNVVMLTGYQPILGNSFCIVSLNASDDLEMRLVVPADEADLVPSTGVQEIKTYTEETMTHIGDTIEAVCEPLGELIRAANFPRDASVGCEGGHSPIATGYTEVGVPGPMTLELLREFLPEATLCDATSMLDELAAIKTDAELSHIRIAEAVAFQGFCAAREAVHHGATEAAVAAATYTALLEAGYDAPGAMHVLPHVHVMSGPRAALAYRAFNLTSNRTIQPGDPVTVQMEIGVNGYWAELTRTFFAGDPGATWRNAHLACVKAQDAALQVIRAGVSGKEADSAARQVMDGAGLGPAFKHGLGHGFGFQAINHAAAPVLHPASTSILADGMIHNMEPAVYIDGQGGLRLNDNVLVRPAGNELLSAQIPRDLDWLVVGG